MRKLSDYLGRLQKCANLSLLEGAPSWVFGGGGPNHLGKALGGTKLLPEKWLVALNFQSIGFSVHIKVISKKKSLHLNWDGFSVQIKEVSNKKKKFFTEKCPKHLKLPKILTQNCPNNIKSPKILMQNCPKHMKLPEILTRDRHLKTKRGASPPPTSYATDRKRDIIIKIVPKKWISLFLWCK